MPVKFLKQDQIADNYSKSDWQIFFQMKPSFQAGRRRDCFKTW